MPTDSKKLNKLFDKIIDFNQARGWTPLSPQDIAKSIVIEAAELLELYQWDNMDIKYEKGLPPKNIEEIEKELADITWYIVTFCHETGINLADALEKKYTHNSVKYPAEMFHGKHNEEFYKKRKAEYRQNRK